MLLIYLPFGFLRSVGAQASGARSPPQSRLTSLTFLTLGIVETSFTLLSLTRKVGEIAQTSNVSVPLGMGTA